MSNAPSQRRVSQTQPSAESWHSVPSHHTSASSSGNNDPQSNDRAGSPEVIVDLTSGHALDHRRDSDASVYRIRSGEKKKCWICLIEEGETLSNGNPMNTSRWAKACACSLDAHESCLITWINQSRGGDANKTVLPLTVSVANCPDELSAMQRTVQITTKVVCFLQTRKLLQQTHRPYRPLPRWFRCRRRSIHCIDCPRMVLPLYLLRRRPRSPSHVGRKLVSSILHHSHAFRNAIHPHLAFSQSNSLPRFRPPVLATCVYRTGYCESLSRYEGHVVPCTQVRDIAAGVDGVSFAVVEDCVQ